LCYGPELIPDLLSRDLSLALMEGNT